MCALTPATLNALVNSATTAWSMGSAAFMNITIELRSRLWRDASGIFLRHSLYAKLGAAEWVPLYFDMVLSQRTGDPTKAMGGQATTLQPQTADISILPISPMSWYCGYSGANNNNNN